MLDKTFIDPRVKIENSPISGIGLFAVDYIPKWDVVVHRWGGLIVTNEEFERWYELGKYQPDTAIHYDSGHKRVGLAETPDYEDAAINHSCDPNLWFENGRPLVARRDISPWEEITFHYATGETYPLHHECTCGSPMCCKNITWEEWKNIDFQRRYENHFNPYIQGLIDAEQQ